MISSLIFSKDRALQLDLLLNSIYENFPETLNDLRVLWTASSNEFELAYQKLQVDHPRVIFKKQGSSFFEDSYENICTANYPCVCLFTDDDILYRKARYDSTIEDLLMNDNSFVCYSLRLGRNVVHRDIEGVECQDVLPQVYSYKDLTVWDRHSIQYGGYWAYPFSIDGHIFRKTDLMIIVEAIMNWVKQNNAAENPNQLEAQMQNFNHSFGNMMICDNLSSVVNSPNNRVQNLFPNRHGDQYSFSQEYFNNLYLAGKRIKLDKIDFGNINKGHKELNLLGAIE